MPHGQTCSGDIVIVPFPQTDLKPGKLRPALVFVDLAGADLILCQITSQARSDGFSIALATTDLIRGNLPVASFIRPNRIFTVDQTVIVRIAGHVTHHQIATIPRCSAQNSVVTSGVQRFPIKQWLEPAAVSHTQCAHLPMAQTPLFP